GSRRRACGLSLSRPPGPAKPDAARPDMISAAGPWQNHGYARARGLLTPDLQPRANLPGPLAHANDAPVAGAPPRVHHPGRHAGATDANAKSHALYGAFARDLYQVRVGVAKRVHQGLLYEPEKSRRDRRWQGWHLDHRDRLEPDARDG